MEFQLMSRRFTSFFSNTLWIFLLGFFFLPISDSQVIYANLKLISELNITLDGGAATAEFMDSIPIEIDSFFGTNSASRVEQDSIELPWIEIQNNIPATCGKQNGSLLLRGTHGSGPYQFSLDGRSFQPDSLFTQLPSGNYQCFVLDKEGHQNEITAVVLETASITILGIETTPTACGAYTGSILLSLAGGTGDIQYSIDNHPFQRDGSFVELGEGHYILQAVDAMGCESDTVITIIREGCPIYIPNIFSPNGDGVNDFFILQTAEHEQVTINRFYIFDRWGNNVYSASNLDIHATQGWWDGTYKRFTLNTGVFAYYIEAEFESGEKITYKGDVTLVR